MKYFIRCRERYQETLKKNTPLDNNSYPVGFYSESFVSDALAEFEAAAAANEGVPTLRTAVLQKEWSFLYQVLFHLPKDENGLADRDRVLRILDRLGKMAGELKRQKEFMGLSGAKPESLDKQVPGCGRMIISWVKEWHKKWMKEMMNVPEKGTEDDFLDALE